MAPRTRKAKKNSSSKESGDVPRQEKRRDEDKSIVDSAKKSTAVTRPRKRRCDESKSIVDSPKKICYDKASTSMEKRDKIYCSTIAKSKLKSLRMSPDDDDDSDDFAGFKKDDADDSNNGNKNMEKKLKMKNSKIFYKTKIHGKEIKNEKLNQNGKQKPKKNSKKNEFSWQHSGPQGGLRPHFWIGSLDASGKR